MPVNPHTHPGSPSKSIDFPAIERGSTSPRPLGHTASNPYGWCGFGAPQVFGDTPYGSAGAPVNPYHRSQQTGEP
jgi:hypothetical protein